MPLIIQVLLPFHNHDKQTSLLTLQFDVYMTMTLSMITHGLTPLIQLGTSVCIDGPNWVDRGALVNNDLLLHACHLCIIGSILNNIDQHFDV